MSDLLSKPGTEMSGDRQTFTDVSHTERHVLDAAALRRRQLCAAFLHGSRRSWRRRRRIWPAATAGLLVVAIVVAAFSVTAAFHRQQEINREYDSGRSADTSPMSSPVVVPAVPS